jgi:predicted Zn finger-like uncharacterized protein
MSHVTQCPACSTHFRVVVDQLKISDGWVRCGQCGEVFDARVSMQPWPVQPSPVPPAQAVPDAAVDAAPDPEALQVPQTETAAPQPWPDLDVEAAPIRSEAVPEVDAEPEREPLSPASGLAEEAEPAEQTLTGESVRPDAEAAPLAPEDIAPSVGFVRQAQRRAAWRRPWVRALGALSGLVLAAVLVGQVLVHERHYLAAAHPDWLPVLQQVCEPLACTIEPYRRIESVLIDSSALVREREDLYRLEVGLKNTSDMALAVPALELSLTDSADEVVLRRVLLPSDWEAPADILAPSATLALSLHLSLSGASELRMAGYRALVFYP